MKIQEAWDIIKNLEIELVEEYTDAEYERWHEAIRTLEVIFEKPRIYVVGEPRVSIRRKRKNHSKDTHKDTHKKE